MSKLHDLAVFLTIVVIIYIASLLLMHHISKHESFIGRRNKINYLIYLFLSTLRHTTVVVISACSIYVNFLLLFTAIPIMVIYVGIIVMDILKIIHVIIENKENVEIVDKLYQYNIFVGSLRQFKAIASLKVATVDNMYFNFYISMKDRNTILDMYKHNISLGKVHYYKSSGRIYGIEAVEYQE